MSSDKKFFDTYNMAVMAIGAALITSCSWISFNFGDVPFTLQTFAVFAVLMLLGGKRGTVSIIVYLLMGLVGLPVFAGFKSGVHVLIGPTGGFLVGFIVVGLVYILLGDIVLARTFRKFTQNRTFRIAARIAVCIICSLILYVIGTIWFVNIYTSDSGSVGYATAIAWCVTPFIIPDLVKLVLAVLLAERIDFVIKK